LPAVVIAGVGCAPLTGLRPASMPMPGTDHEVGAGAGAITPRPYVQEPVRVAGHLWGGLRAAPWLVLSGVLAFDDEAAVGGLAARADWLDHDRLLSGVELELGWAWAALSFPLALRLFDQTWLYTAPRIGTFADQVTPFVPLGLDARIYEGLKIRVEGQVSWAAFDVFNRRFHLGAGVAYDW
jgi:hypothetical protein